jgi:glutathione S-transferase
VKGNFSQTVKVLSFAMTQRVFFAVARLMVTFSVVEGFTRSGCGLNRLSRGQTEQQSFQPLASFFEDMASNLLGKILEVKPQVDKRLQDVAIPSWKTIRTILEGSQAEEERTFRSNLVHGYGIGSPLHKVRLYDETNKEEDVRVTFYRDSASWCPYCQKVWISLEEKKIPYRVEKINMSCYGDKPVSFRMLQPNGQIPVATIDGKTYRQSNDILYALEQSFPEHKSLMPPPGMESQAQELLRLERQIFSAWMYWLTSGVNKDGFIDTLKRVESELSRRGPFFLGKEVSTVDLQYAPFLERMAASLLYYKGFKIRAAPGEKNPYPAINRWFDAMEKLPSYQLTKSDYYTHCWDLPPQLGGCVSEPGGEKYRAIIDGKLSLDGSRGSWELPLIPHQGGVEPDWAWAGDASTAQREAVERVSANYEAIVRFAARGAGTKGMPPVMAPLADPNAKPSDAVIGSVDNLLRLICLAMLEGTQKYEQDVQKVAKTIMEVGGSDFTNGVIQSLEYMRDRVGVPRDMKLPAALQLRAHTNWAIANLKLSNI